MGEVTVLFDSLVTDLRNFDPSVYRSWLEGEVVRVAARQRDIIAPSDDTARLFAGRWNELLFRETQDQFRAFQRLEHFLQRPKIWLGDTLEHELPDGVCRWMIERYYDFDDSVARELAGKKMSSKLRKDLDDVAQSSSVSLASCQRQFDNFKRVGHEVSTAETDTIALIVERFCLSPDLARRYAAFLFLAHHRIDLSKRCLASLTYPVVETLAEIMMHEWTRPDSGTLALDENLSERARDLKAVVTATRSGIDELRDLVRQRVVEAWGIRRGETATRRFVRSSDAWSRVESRIPSVLRGIFGVCGSLHNAREFKDVLVVTVERVAEPLMKAGLSDMMVRGRGCARCVCRSALLGFFVKHTTLTYIMLETHCSACRSWETGKRAGGGGEVWHVAPPRLSSAVQVIAICIFLRTWLSYSRRSSCTCSPFVEPFFSWSPCRLYIPGQ